MKIKYIKFRCTNNEKERIESMAHNAGVTTSEYCRQQCINGKILATPRLTDTEIMYFKELKEHNNALARISNIIQNRYPNLKKEIEQYLSMSRELYSRFF